MDLTVMYISNEVKMEGAAQSLIDMLKGIKRYVRPVVIIPCKGIIEERFTELDILYYIIPYSIGFSAEGTHTRKDEDRVFADNYEAALRLVPIVGKEKVDLIHTNSSVCNVGAMAALLTGKPHVWHIRECERHFNFVFWDKGLKELLFGQADAVIAISDFVKREYQEKYNLEPVCIYDGLDVERFWAEPGSGGKKGNIFLMAGGIYAEKGQWDAIRAVEALVKDGLTDIKLLIVGGGQQKTVWTMKKYVKIKALEQYVHILPFQKDLSRIRECCAFSVCASRMEALGRATIEAMLAGNIVIGADTGATPELVGSGEERGYLFRQGDCLALAGTMQRAIEDSDGGRKGRLEKARKFAAENFNLECYTEKILSVYREVAGQGDRRPEGFHKGVLSELEERYKALGRQADRQEDGIRISDVGEKFQKLFLQAEQWLHIRQGDRTLAEYFTERNIHGIAIYGMGYLGCDLYDELEGSGVEIRYVIDRNPECLGLVARVAGMDGVPEEVDAIVVTMVGEEALKKRLREKYSVPILDLSEILASFETAEYGWQQEPGRAEGMGKGI